MAVSGVALTVTFGVWDVTNGAWKTGDNGNLTLRLTADGTEATPANASSEIDATNAPGQYKITLTAGENTGTDMMLGGKSATSGCVVIPATWQNTAVAVSTPPTAAAVADAVWDEASTGHTDAGKAGAQLWTDIDAIAVDVAGLDGAAMVAAAPTAANIADAVWDEASTGHVDAGKAGAQVWTDIDAIAVDVAGLDGAAMRGTDGAYTGTPPTAASIADAVWDETSTGHTDAGKAGAAVWTTVPAIATILSGITSLAAWLRGLARKDAMDATAKNELNTGGGAYNEATDSVEALRDRGDAAWITATGFELNGAATAAVGTLNDISTLESQAAAAAALAAYGAATATDVTTATSGLSTVTTAQVLAQVNAALNTAIPGTPTAGSINERIKALDDLLQAAGAGDAAAIKTAAEKVAALVETAGGHDRFAATALEAAPAGTGLNAQETRDALMLAPSAGVPAAGSVDAHLDAAALEATLTAMKGTGWTSENLTDIQAAAEAASGAVGTGSKSVTIQVNDGDGNAVPNVKVTVKNSAQTANIGIQTTNSSGATPSGFGLDASTTYKVVLSGVDSGYTYSNPYTVVTTAGAAAQTATLVVTAVELPAAAAAGYCTVYCAEEVQNGDYPVGHFWITAYKSPATRTVGAVKVDITYGPDECDISATTGQASLQILQGAVVSLKVKTEDQTLEKVDVVVPASAGPVNWNDLVAEA